MRLKLKKDNSHRWSILETWNDKYKYGSKGTVKVPLLVPLSFDLSQTQPQVLVDGTFWPLQTRLKGTSLTKWLRGHRATYSLVEPGVVLLFTVKYNLKDNSLLYDESSVAIYKPVFENSTEGTLALTKLYNLSSDVQERAKQLIPVLFGTSVSRENFLQNRIALYQ